MNRTLLVHSAQLYDGTIGGVTPDGAFLVEDGMITHVGKTSEAALWLGLPADRGSDDVEVVDACGAPVVPGYVDIHHHGGGGVSFDDGIEASRAALTVHLGHGTTSSVLSYVTGDVEVMTQRLAAGARLADENPKVLGLHAEGPFLHQDFKGAHDQNLLRDPDPRLVHRLIESADGHLRQLTLAPERSRGIEAVRNLSAAGVVPAVGHTSTDFDTAQAAFDAGARILTHAFNGMRGIHHRAPGPVIAELRDSRVWLEVINDGIHVHPAVVASLFAEAPERVILVTDAMSATCSPDGHYMLGNLEVTVTDGVARLSEGDSLAGSTLTMDRAVANAVQSVGVALDVAVAAATSHPAAAIGASDRCGRLAVGMPADFLVLDHHTLLPAEIRVDGIDTNEH